ncbi:MAG: ATP-binding cassette domain-containing protein [Proteobacteria bacterium]|nr:ATP-binding cassette domain-containing protein [Pseudomonadota bacterium]
MLCVEKITVNISAYTILRGLTLKVPTGGIVALVGRNGAGKTTTMRSIMGLTPVSEGKISLDDHNLRPLPSHQRAKLGIGYLPEDRRLINALTVEDNLLVPVQALGLSEAEAEARLKSIYSLLPEVRVMANRKAVQLSGGQQKLVALARSFVNGKKLLLLDEPFEGISTALSQKLAQVIREFQNAEEGLSVLVAESDLKRAAMLTDRAYLIERGEVDEESFIG